MARQNKQEEGAGHAAVPSSKIRQEQGQSAAPLPPIARRARHDPQKGQEGQGQVSAPVRTTNEENDGTNTNIKLVHPRLLLRNLENQEALVRQRREYGPDLSRRTFDLGDRLVSALGPADQETGRRGAYDSRCLAEELIGDINQLIEFALLNGQVPTRIEMLIEHVHALEDIRSVVREELRNMLAPIIQAEVRAALQDLVPGHEVGPSARGGIGEDAADRERTQGWLTEVDPKAQGMLASLFGEE
jgi:hypothetical protein